MNYYNEHDPKAAAWLRELIKQGLIPEGTVDERSIRDVEPGDLRGYTQCHFFSGIGGWSLALRLAGWEPERPVWTGSCPCQPFSAAGKQRAQSDDRHLWPVFMRLIAECRPGVVFGEQVANAVGLGWLDGVSADLEAEGYACGPVVLGAHSLGAPHQRQRLFWVADAGCSGGGWNTGTILGAEEKGQGERCESRSLSDELVDGGAVGPVADSYLGTGGQGDEIVGRRDQGSDAEPRSGSGGGGVPGTVADTDGGHPGPEREQRGGEQRLFTEGGGCEPLVQPCEPRLEGLTGDGCDRDQSGRIGAEPGGSTASSGPIGGRSAGAWSDFDVLPCLDGKARRVESGTFPLANGVPARVVRLRGYGNAIVPQVAAEFIRAYRDILAIDRAA